MNDIMMTVIECLISLCIILAMRYVLPYLKLTLLGVVGEELYAEIAKAVKSVEQDVLFKTGTEKKIEVIRRIKAWADANGIVISEEQISQLIEAAVWTMKHEDDLIGGS